MQQTSEILLESEINGVVITTFRYEIWRPLHSELMTYRRCARNASSSRAVPFGINLSRVVKDPYIPGYIGAAHKGMMPSSYLTGWRLTAARSVIRAMSLLSAAGTWILDRVGASKSICNRYLEPYNLINVVMTGSDQHWRHLFRQRMSGTTEPNLKNELVIFMTTKYITIRPQHRSHHMPFWTEDLSSLDIIEQGKICAARVARLSYCQHGNPKMDTAKDLELADYLLTHGHLSPFEAVVFAEVPECYRDRALEIWDKGNAISDRVVTLRQIMEIVHNG